MRLAKTLLFTLLLFSLSSAAAVDFTPILPVTAVVVVIFIALMNMMGIAISSPQIQAWVKTEIRELIAGIILVVIIYSFFIGSVGISSALTGTGDYLNASVNIIDNILTNETVGYDRAMHDIIRAATRIRAAATYSPYLSVPLWYVGLTYSTAPMSGVGILFAPLSSATQGIANIVFLYEGIALLLRFSATAVPAVLLPIALSLRLIPFTRKIGNTLIAISLAALVLLPFSVFVVDAIHKSISYPQAYLTGFQLDRLDPGAWAMTIAEPFCENMVVRTILSLNDLLFSMLVCLPLAFIPIVGSALFAACQPLVQNVIYPIFMVALQIIYDAALLSWISFAGEGTAYANEAFNIVYPFLMQVNNLVLLGYLDAIIIGIITISGARSISVALGGEWYLGGIQRLI
jgi:hypothetical protein